jgi:pyruvate/2-oxoglutarate dehydrogenase complex dihydrolipoamide acyltransferase (E2) component
MAERVFSLPDLGEGLEEGKILEWLVVEGDEVTLNQPLVEVETAKAVVEIPSPYAGRVVALHGEVGFDVPVGAALVTFAVGGPEAGGPGGVTDRGLAPPSPTAGAAGATVASGTVAATPPVRRLAKELGVDIQSVRGTGPGGRVTEADVRAAAGVVEAKPAEQADVEAPFEAEAISAGRRAVAERLSRVTREVPQVTTWRTVDCTALEALRTELGVSPLPVFVRALAGTLSRHPELNSSWDAEAGVIRRYTRVDVGLGVDTSEGLRTAKVRDAGTKSIGEIAEEVGRLAASARDGSLRLEDSVGSTITVSNTGSYGSESGTPILNPGEAVILALGVIGARALVVDGQVLARPAATISCTFDHRVLDGATVGRALSDLVALLESAERLGSLPR